MPNADNGPRDERPADTTAAGNPPAAAGDLDDQQLDRLATLFADGAQPLPTDLSSARLDRLVGRVRELRRRRLRLLIARQVAASMKADLATPMDGTQTQEQQC